MACAALIVYGRPLDHILNNENYGSQTGLEDETSSISSDSTLESLDLGFVDNEKVLSENACTSTSNELTPDITSAVESHEARADEIGSTINDTLATSSSEVSALPDNSNDNVTVGLNILENTIPNDENYNSTINRLLSFPDSYPFARVSVLAENGFYFITTQYVLLCQFCRLHVDLNLINDDSMTTQHQCVEQRHNNKKLLSNLTNYRYEANRIISFLRVSWNKEVGNLPVGALDLARWGFYYVDAPDRVRCAFCRLEVQGWEVGDSAEGEHRRWNSYCPFINGKSIGNIKLGQEEDSKVQNDRISLPHDVTGFRAIPGIMQASPPKHPEYASLPSRLGSYTLWPVSLPQRPENLAQAGFYYTGKGDRVICYQCGGGLTNWEVGDDPWVQHAMWFPRCVHVNMQKGKEFVENAQNGHQQENDQVNYATNLTSHCSEPMETQQEAAINLQIESTTEAKIPITRQCKVCMDKELGIVFLPCGHMASCTDCAPQLSKCPVCRGELTAYIRAFLP